MSDSIRNRLVVDSCRTEDGIFLIEQFLKELGIKNFKCNIYNDNIYFQNMSAYETPVMPSSNILSITQNSVWICLFFGDTEHFNKLVRDYINEIPSIIKKFRRNREINKILE